MWKSRLPALLAGVAVAASAAFAPLAQAALKVGDPVTLPEVRLLDGQVLPEGYFEGKPVIVEFWASWCPFCARQNPYIQKLWLLAKDQGLEVLTISIDRVEADAVDYVAKHQYTFPAAMESDALRAVFGKRKVVPEIFVIKADGHVTEVIPGEMFEEDVLDLIKYAPSNKPR